MPAALELNPAKSANRLTRFGHLASATTLLSDPPAAQRGAWVEGSAFGEGSFSISSA